jgi:hypothetical protein
MRALGALVSGRWIGASSSGHEPQRTTSSWSGRSDSRGRLRGSIAVAVGVSASRLPSPYVHQQPRLGLRVVTEPAPCLRRRVARDQPPRRRRPHRDLTGTSSKGRRSAGPVLVSRTCPRHRIPAQELLSARESREHPHRGCCGGHQAARSGVIFSDAARDQPKRLTPVPLRRRLARRGYRHLRHPRLLGVHGLRIHIAVCQDQRRR